MFQLPTTITIEVLSLVYPHAKYVSPYPEVHKFSKNLEATFKFYAPDDCNKAGSIPRTQIISRHRIKSIRPGELTPRNCAQLAVTRTIQNAMYCSNYLDTAGHTMAQLVETLGSIPDAVIGVFHGHSPSDRTTGSSNLQDLHRGCFTYLNYA